VKMLQNVLRMARGMVTRGFADSPAPIAQSSVPWKAKPALISTAQKPTNFATATFSARYGANAPGESQYLKPMYP